jgi:hypothetical protein
MSAAKPTERDYWCTSYMAWPRKVTAASHRDAATAYGRAHLDEHLAPRGFECFQDLVVVCDTEDEVDDVERGSQFNFEEVFMGHPHLHSIRVELQKKGATP